MRRSTLILFAILAAVSADTHGQTVADRAPKRVLIIDSFGPRFEPFSTASASFRTELAKACPDPVEFFEVSLETARFAEGAVDERLAAYVKSLCDERRPDLVVSIASPAMRFCARHHEALFPGVPVLAAAVETRHLKSVDLGPNAATVGFVVDDTQFLQTVLRLLPDTKQIDVVFGNSPLERFWVGELQRSWKQFESRVSIEWLNKMTFAEVQKSAASLPPHSAIVFAMMDVDAAGIPYEQSTALETLHAIASAPVFGFYDLQMGHGIVGSYLIQTRRLGAESAHVAVRILGGEPASTIPLVMVPSGPAEFDWRELERWHIKASRLPPGSVIRFREPSAWARYKHRILLVSALCVLEALFIVVIMVQRNRTRAAQRRLIESEKRAGDLRRELQHSDRVSLAGQLTASLAHELGQPLGAILRNTDAAELFLKQESPDLGEVRSILADIRRDDARASSVIEKLRAFLRRQEIDMRPVDCNDLVGDVFHIAGSVARARDIALENDIQPGVLRVRGDRVQLQQVLLNLVVNAMDAIDGHVDRRVIVSLRSENNGWVDVMVRDTGTGVAPERMQSIFDAFVTTKPAGMGMGLPISKSIVEAHGGRLWAEHNTEGGMSFHFTIPAADGENA